MLMHALMLGSRANGPGLRAVVWFQGCTLGCRSCWNRQTHPFRGEDIPPCDLNHKMAASAVLYFLGAADSRNTAALSVG
jgi:pyruvate-formate lyase-activating enzyme